MTDYTATRRSVEQIERIAIDVLATCPKLPNGAIDILTALRQREILTICGKKVLRLKLLADDLLPDKFAQMWAGNGRVTITARASVWSRAAEYDPEALKILRHEYSHAVLHSGEKTAGGVALNKQISGNKVHGFIDTEQRVEDQADWLECCLAMPKGKILATADVRDIVADWTVTFDEAEWRLKQVRLSASKRIPDTIKRRLDAMRAAADIPVAAQSLWDSLPLAEGFLPNEGRLACRYLVEYSQYRRYTQTGWDVEQGQIVPLMLKMQV